MDPIARFYYELRWAMALKERDKVGLALHHITEEAWKAVGGPPSLIDELGKQKDDLIPIS